MSNHGWHRLSQRLTMREVAELAGYVDDDGKVNACHLVRAKRHLRRLEEQTGRKLVWVDRNRKAWTTLEAMRAADPAMVTADKADAERLEELADTIDKLIRDLRCHKAMLRDTDRRLTALESKANRSPFVKGTGL